MIQPAADPTRLAAIVRHRQMTTPVLLFLAGHRPLAFFAAQALYAVAPLGMLLGLDGLPAWAELLGTTQGLRRLESALSGSVPPLSEVDSHVLE